MVENYYFRARLQTGWLKKASLRCGGLSCEKEPSRKEMMARQGAQAEGMQKAGPKVGQSLLPLRNKKEARVAGVLRGET